jgi:hypothetical protein
MSRRKTNSPADNSSAKRRGGRPRQQWLSFEEARLHARSLGLRSFNEWLAFAKSARRPKDIPAAPRAVYASEWKGVADFLGYKSKVRYPVHTRKWRPFKEARKFARSLKLKSWWEWRVLLADVGVPDDIPYVPETAYREEWGGYADFLGYPVKPGATNYHPPWRSFNEARKFAHSLKFQSIRQWRACARAAFLPTDIPRSPPDVYRSEWKGYPDFLGYEPWRPVHQPVQSFRSFRKTRMFAQALKMNSRAEWLIFARSKRRPEDIPPDPDKTFAGQWSGWPDFLGYKLKLRRRPASMPWQPFAKAREFVRSLNLKSSADWHAFVRSGRCPSDLPSNPQQVYAHDWLGIPNFLGFAYASGRQVRRRLSHPPWRSYTKARMFVRSLGLRSMREWKLYAVGKITGLPPIPPDIPASPDTAYRNQWAGARDFLGEKFMSFQEAKALLRSIPIRTNLEYNLYRRGLLSRAPSPSKRLPDSPDIHYRGTWAGWDDFLSK